MSAIAPYRKAIFSGLATVAFYVFSVLAQGEFGWRELIAAGAVGAVVVFGVYRIPNTPK